MARMVRVSKIQLNKFKTNGYKDSSGTDAAWKRARSIKLSNNPSCEVAGCHSTGGVEVHHKIPVSKGGSKTAQSNLVTLCKRHHDREHAHSHRFQRMGFVKTKY